MLRPCVVALLLLPGCTTTEPGALAVPGLPPDVPVAVPLPAGALVEAELSSGTPDEPEWRAALVLWREALRQSERFVVLDTGAHGSGAARLQLAIDPSARALSAFCRLPDGREHALAGASFRDGGLPAAVDRLAWTSRRALGEPATEPPVPSAASVSGDTRAVLAADDGFVLLRDGAIEGASRALLDARTRDGGSPFVLDGLASVALLRGDPTTAQRLCLEALGLSARLAPTTQHRLARTLLLARASLRPDDAPQHDRELLQLGRTGQRERPYDPQPALSLAIAHNFLGEFAAARPLLESLRERLPQQAIVAYHLGWACLATHDPAAAVAQFEEAALRLPMPWVVVPRAIALHDAGDDDGLAGLLDRLAAEHDPQAGTLVHDLRRMQAAHALLRQQPDAAADHLLRDLRWLLAHPTALEARAGELAEQGEVLVRLGRGGDLPPLLLAMQGQHPGSAVADSCAYLSGLAQIAATGERVETLEGQLSRGGDSVWALRLQAFAHERRGELADLHAALARAARLSDSPLTKALLAKSLRAMGKIDQAIALRTALRSEMSSIHLRRRPQHPLLGPELAFAFLLE